MSSTERRRNGSQASCEPCRKGKLRCDHQKPFCAPCGRRGREARCWYHPAPLTRPRVPETSGVTTSMPHLTPHAARLAAPPGEYVSIDMDANFKLEEMDTTQSTPRAWSFVYNEHPDSAFPSHTLVLDDQREHQGHLTTLREICEQLRFFSIIESLFEEYFSFSQAAIVPRPIVRRLVASIKSSVVASGQEGHQSKMISLKIPELATKLLGSAPYPVTVIPTHEPNEFCALFSGENLRIETLGLVYTIAARSYLYRSRRQNNRLEGFVQQIIRCSNLSLRLARELKVHANDVTVWLGLENLQLMSLLEGQGSLSTWRRLGDLTTDIYALDMHREESYAADKVPFFLAEFRRRTFGFAFYLDKASSCIFRQPPRISARYADCKQPLDLSDDEAVAATAQGLETLQHKLTADGWNTDGCYRSTTWARLRYRWAEMELEIIDFQFRAPQASDVDDLRELLKRCQRSWDDLPQHLRYDPSCWTSKLPPGTCLMLGKVRLCYLHITFKIHKLLSKVEPDNGLPLPELLEICAKMLETSVQIVGARNREGYFPYPVDLSSHVTFFGLPAAAMLTTALQDVARDPSRRLPPSINRALIIRNVSVLLSQVENFPASDETQSTDQASSIQAAKMISRQLDRILEDTFTAPASTAPMSTAAAGREDPEAVSVADYCSEAATLALTGIQDVESEEWEPFDFENWATSAAFDMECNRFDDWDMF